MKVLNFGSLNIDYVYQVDDFVKKGQTISSLNMHTYSGGKGLNQSIALARSGVPVFHAGAVGDDGKFLIDVLNEENINTKFVRKDVSVKTGHAIIQNNKHGDNCILLYGGANERIDRDYVDFVLKEFDGGDILLLQNEISELQYIVNQAYEKGMTIILNPSPMNEKIFELDMNKISYIFMNEYEAQMLARETSECMEVVIQKIKSTYPELKILLTLGEKGAVYFDKNMIVKQPAYQVDVVDTTAAGDTYTGYFIGGMIQYQNIQESMNMASKASALAVMKKGAAPSIPYYNQVKLFNF